VLAVGSTRSWRDAVIGAAGAVALLAVVVVAVGPLLLARLPLAPLKVVIGVALLLFGLEWLRKGVLRLAGRRSPSDSFKEYLEEREALEGMEAVPPGEADWAARIVAGKGVLLEGVEVVLIVAALGAGPKGLTPAVAGAGLAVVLTLGIGFVLHRPLMRLPESHLKYAVGIVLSSFGVFFLGEGLAVEWPLSDGALLYIAATLLVVSQGQIAAFAREPVPA
jgi:Ca2+/H+ antiporter, TMEM165/GDT1 family